MAYSVDFRKKILETYLAGEESNPLIADRFKISISTVKRIVRIITHREQSILLNVNSSIIHRER